MTVSTGVAAALVAPLLEAVGFLEWDIYWSKHGGSAFALNLYKCNLAAFLFFSYVVFENIQMILDTAMEYFTDPHQTQFTDEINEVQEQQLNQENGKFTINDGINVQNTNHQNNEETLQNYDNNRRLQQQQQQQHGETVIIHNIDDNNIPSSMNNNAVYNQNDNSQLPVPPSQNAQSLQQPQNSQIPQTPPHLIPTQQQQQQQNVQILQQPQSSQLPQTPPHLIQATQQQQSQIQQNAQSSQQLQTSQFPQTRPHLVQTQQQQQSQMHQQQNMQSLQQPQDTQFPQTRPHLVQTQQQQQQQMPQEQQHPSLDPAYVQTTYHYPFAEHYHQIPILILSSFLGIIIGDLAELEALRLIGARRILMVYTIKPFAAALLGNMLLDEPLYIAAFVGMILTALGVYVVLMASLEKLEKVRKHQRRATLKRNSDSIVFSAPYDDDRSLKSFDTNSGGSSFDEDEEIFAIINGETKNGHDTDLNSSFQMVGMRRRPLSRHDFTADYGDHEFEEGDTDNLMMMLESGRGVIDTTICCNRTTSPSGKDVEGSSGSSDSWENSWCNQSFDSMNSLDKLDMDVMNAMENFGSDDEIGADMDNLYDAPTPEKSVFDESEAILPVAKLKSAETIKEDGNNMNAEKPLKSALKKSKYGGQSSNENSLKSNQSNETPILSLSNKNNSSLAPSRKVPLIQNREYFKKKDRGVVPTGAVPRTRSSGSMTSMNSSGSLASMETECGPPPGLYQHSNKESKIERKVRIRTGYVLSTLNVILDAYCSYLTKKHGVGLTTWEINLCRVGFAGFILTTIAYFMKFLERRRRKKEKLEREQREFQSPFFGQGSSSKRTQGQQTKKDPPKIKIRPWYRLPKMPVVPWIIVSVGVFFVMFLSPALAQYSLFQIPIALSISLTSITPLFTIPLGVIMKGERPTRRGLFGALLSMIGVIILCIWGVDSESFE